MADFNLGQPKSRGFLLNTNRDGPDRIHDADNLTERCNTDDVLGGQRIDRATGLSLIESSPAEQLERCKHCLRELRG